MAPSSVRLAYLVAASCCALVAGAPSCGNVLGPELPTLSVTVYIADHEYFDNEPVYFAFQLTNTGSDTAWVMPFDLAEQSLQAVLVRSDGTRVLDWGIVADYITGPGWRGVPIVPHRSVYEIGLLQDRWGQYDSTLLNLTIRTTFSRAGINWRPCSLGIPSTRALRYGHRQYHFRSVLGTRPRTRSSPRQTGSLQCRGTVPNGHCFWILSLATLSAVSSQTLKILTYPSSLCKRSSPPQQLVTRPIAR